MVEKNKAIFLDRDGVINKERSDYVKSLNEFEIFSNVIHCIKMLKEAGYLIIIITNQSAINRGLMTHNDLQGIHDYLQRKLEQNDALIDSIYYCPHRPDEKCDCRKPKPSLLLKAISEYDIDPMKSWMIGNNDSDMIAASTVNCKGIKINKNFTLDDAVQKILNLSKS